MVRNDFCKGGGTIRQGGALHDETMGLGEPASRLAEKALRMVPKGRLGAHPLAPAGKPGTVDPKDETTALLTHRAGGKAIPPARLACHGASMGGAENLIFSGAAVVSISRGAWRSPSWPARRPARPGGRRCCPDRAAPLPGSSCGRFRIGAAA